MVLKLSCCNGLEIYIDGIKVQCRDLELPSGKHLIRVEQDNPLYKRYWIKALLNPFCFWGFAFFKSEHTLHKAYNSQAAVWEGEIELHRDARLSADLRLSQLNGNYLKEYWSIEIQGKDLKSVSGRRVEPSSLFRKRWIALRLIPCFITAIFLWIVGLTLRNTLLIPFIYTLLVIIRGIFLFRNKAII